jgi:PKD domain-containing protein
LTLLKIGDTIVLLQETVGRKDFKGVRKKFYASLAALVIVLSAVLTLNVFNGKSMAALPRDCDNNAIIHCGAATSAELAQKYNENKTGDLKTIYDHYGISAEMIAAGGQMGEAHKDGRITVNGKTVATGGMSIGRQQINGSSKVNVGGREYFQSSNSTAFRSESIAAFVFTDSNGQFVAAILTACANPVGGYPVPPEKPPVPPKKPAPVYKCEGLAATDISRDEYQFTAAAFVSGGATVTGYTFDFGDGKIETVADKTASHKYDKPGEYVATVTVNVTANGEAKTATGPQCQLKVVVTEEPKMCPTNPSLPVDDEGCAPCPIPGKEQYPKDSPECVTETPPVVELPKTGPMDFIGGSLGVGSLIAAASYWYASRRGLLEVWLSR